MKETAIKRGVVLFAAASAVAFLGCILTWSIISGALRDAYDWSPQTLSLIYSVFTLSSFTAQNISGKLQGNLKPRTIMLVASLILATGWTLPSLITSVPTLFVGVSIMGGCGHGMCYNTALATAAKWFPDRKGFANGVCIGCMGLSPLAFGPIVGALVESIGVSQTFRVIGAVVGLAVFSLAWLMKAPPGWDAQSKSSPATSLRTVVRNPVFWFLWLIFISGAIPGATLIGHISEIGRRFAGLPLDQAALLVSVMAVANFVGRLGFGEMSDRIGRFRTLALDFALATAGMLLFPFGESDLAILSIALFLVAVGYGGVLAIIPALCSDLLGEAGFARNYALLFSAFTTAAFIGTNSASAILVSTGSYRAVFAVDALIALLGLGATIALFAFVKSRRALRDERDA